jgi:CHAD domain-containing protein
MELKTGQHVSLIEAAEELLVVPFSIGHSSKSARGYALATGTTPGPQRAVAVKLSEDDTVALAFEKIVVGCMEQMHANEQSMLANGGIEAIHQFRVSLRRLRAIVRAYRELIDNNVHETLSIDLRWAQRAFGPARDFDVYVSETLDGMLPHMPDDPDFQFFIDVANTARAKARREAMLTLHNPRYSAMQLHLCRNLGRGAWRHQAAACYLDEGVSRFAASKLKALYKEMRRLGDGWRDLGHHDLHRLRILGKRLRYVALAFQSLFKDKPANRFLDRIEAVQDCLGVLNDGVVGRRLTREISGIAAVDRSIQTDDLQRIVAMIEGWQAHAVHERLRDFERIWNDFAAAKRFW